MQLPDLKELDKLIALCRKRGITTVKIGELQLTLSDEAPESKYKRAKATNQATVSYPDTQFESDALTEEELMFYSVPTLASPTNPTGEEQ